MSIYSCLCLYLNVAQCLFYVVKEVAARWLELQPIVSANCPVTPTKSQQGACFKFNPVKKLSAVDGPAIRSSTTLILSKIIRGVLACSGLICAPKLNYYQLITTSHPISLSIVIITPFSYFLQQLSSILKVFHSFVYNLHFFIFMPCSMFFQPTRPIWLFLILI